MDQIMTYEEYLQDVKKGIVTGLGNCSVTPLLLMLQGKWKTQILYELCIYNSVSGDSSMKKTIITKTVTGKTKISYRNAFCVYAAK